jgi:chorismate mutase
MTRSDPSTLCRGVRGATVAKANTRQAILDATRELLARLVEANGIRPDDLASAIFTTTPDLTSAYPAAAARELGWTDVALLCTHEMDVPGGPARCVRVLLHWNTAKSPQEIVHVYMNGAESLRPDRATPAL